MTGDQGTRRQRLVDRLARDSDRGHGPVQTGLGIIDQQMIGVSRRSVDAACWALHGTTSLRWEANRHPGDAGPVLRRGSECASVVLRLQPLPVQRRTGP